MTTSLVLHDGTIRPNLWVISDTHWFHDNIIEYCQRPADHDTIMIERWNETISTDDIVLHLGDLFFGRDSRDKFMDIADLLPGRKFLIRGNHDKQSRSWYSRVGFAVVEPFTAQFIGYPERPPTTVHFSHYPMESKHPKHINVHGHIHRGEHHRGTTDPALGYINVGVEVMDYTPRNLDVLLLASLLYL